MVCLIRIGRPCRMLDVRFAHIPTNKLRKYCLTNTMVSLTKKLLQGQGSIVLLSIILLLFCKEIKTQGFLNSKKINDLCLLHYIILYSYIK